MVVGTAAGIVKTLYIVGFYDCFQLIVAISFKTAWLLTIGIHVIQWDAVIVAPEQMLPEAAFDAWDLFFLIVIIFFAARDAGTGISAAFQLTINNFTGLGGFEAIGFDRNGVVGGCLSFIPAIGFISIRIEVGFAKPSAAA